MDFLTQIKKKLEEMEEQARLLQAMQQSSDGGAVQGSDGRVLFQPRKEFPGESVRQGRRPQGERPSPSEQRPRSVGKQPQRQQSQQQKTSSRERFQTPSCPTEGMEFHSSQALASPPQTVRLIDDLHGRLDEAFLLSEVLGPPRCVRGWED